MGLTLFGRTPGFLTLFRRHSHGTILAEWVLQECVLRNNEHKVMVQKRDRTRTRSSGIRTVLLGTDLKFYVFMSKMKGQYLHTCVLLPISFFPSTHCNVT